MPRLVALDAGTEIDGHSHTRILLTSDGPYYTKFMREDGEARHAPANEQIAHTLLEALGVPVGRRASIELPPSIVTRTPELAKIMNPHGFGLAALSGAFDLRAGQIALLARRTPDRMILAAHVVLDITQQTDHSVSNWLDVDGLLLPIDFARSPSDAVWAGRPLGRERLGHGGLRERLEGIGDATRQHTVQQLDGIDVTFFQDLLLQMPRGWHAAGEVDHMVRELLASKEAVREELAK